MVTQEQFCAMALGFPEAARGSHFDVTDFRVRGRIFATLRVRDGRAVLMLKPDQQHLLMETARGMFEPVPGAWGLKGSTRVRLEATDEATLRHAMAMAWRKAAPKSLL
jgi:hypothetical protein